jgi:ABC-type multidrug transport system ATPase subunit
VRKFGDFIAVNGVTFSVNEDEIFGFLGPNGAGKTTTINMLCTLLRLDAGSIHGHVETVPNRYGYHCHGRICGDLSGTRDLAVQ